MGKGSLKIMILLLLTLTCYFINELKNEFVEPVVLLYPGKEQPIVSLTDRCYS